MNLARYSSRQPPVFWHTGLVTEALLVAHQSWNPWTLLRYAFSSLCMQEVEGMLLDVSIFAWNLVLTASSGLGDLTCNGELRKQLGGQEGSSFLISFLYFNHMYLCLCVCVRAHVEVVRQIET